MDSIPTVEQKFEAAVAAVTAIAVPVNATATRAAAGLLATSLWHAGVDFQKAVSLVDSGDTGAAIAAMSKLKAELRDLVKILDLAGVP